jgi:hypothetical protein
MGLFWEICLESFEILALISGLLGMTLSLSLLLSPDLTRSVSNLLNYYVNLDKKLAFLDIYFKTDQWSYRYHIVFGTGLTAGSVFFLIFLFFKLDVANFSSILNEIIFGAIILLGKITGFAGILLGLLILFAPDKIKKIEDTMNSWFDTKPIVDNLNNLNFDIDTIIFRRPLLIGSTGLIISTILIILSIVNFIKPAVLIP